MLKLFPALPVCPAFHTFSFTQNFDMQTGQKFDLVEERPNSRYDVSRGGGHSSSDRDRYNGSHSDRYNSSSHAADRSYYDSSGRGGGGGGDRDRDTRGGYGGSSSRYYGGCGFGVKGFGVTGLGLRVSMGAGF